MTPQRTGGDPGEVFHIALATDWAAAQESGEYRISTLGRTLAEQGFIHASFARQVRGVLTAFYSQVIEPLIVLRLDGAALPIRLEPAVPGSAQGELGAELFPHIYGPIPVAAVVSAVPLVRDPGGMWVGPGWEIRRDRVNGGQ